MFRRRWSGLPADPIYPANLTELGYFIHSSDEIRSIEEPDCYFKYYQTKNERWNDRHLFAMDEAVYNIVHSRLATLDLSPLLLPLGVSSSSPHVRILATPDLPTKSRTVVIFGDTTHPLGVFSARTANGAGGINKGSAVGLVQSLLAQSSSASDPSPPGVILANPAELWWWPEGGRGLTHTARHGIPMASAVHYGRLHDERKNAVEGNRTAAEHVRYVFEQVLMGKATSKVDIIAVGNAADEVERYLNDDTVWEQVGGLLNSMVILSGFYDVREIKCRGFARFLKDRARAYIIHQSPLDTLVAGSNGNPESVAFTSFGCPVYSAGEANMVETVIVEAQSAMLKWLQQVALEGDSYVNPSLEILGDSGYGVPVEQFEKYKTMWETRERYWRGEEGKDEEKEVEKEEGVKVEGDEGKGEEDEVKGGDKKEDGVEVKSSEPVAATGETVNGDTKAEDDLVEAMEKLH